MKIKKIISIVLAMVMLASVSTVHSIAAGGDIDITPYGQCNHSWVYDPNMSNVPSGKHGMHCTKCTSTMEEECYVSDICSVYYNTPYPTCEVCHITVFDVHTFGYVYTGTSANPTHQLKCVAMGDYGSCLCPNGGHIPCDFPCVWINKSYTNNSSNRGHRLWKQCDDCNNSISVGYFNPTGHAAGIDSSCPYCQMTGTKGEFDISQLLALEDELI